MEDCILQFNNATVIYKEEFSRATDRIMSSLHVQVIDAYRNQWEFTVAYRHRSGDSKDLYWEWRIYRHPGIRNGGEISKDVAMRFIKRFLDLVKYHPILLFNSPNDRYAIHDGFIRLATQLMDGWNFSVKLLN